MKTKLIACAALLMAACCGSPSARKAAATKTEVKHGPEIVLAAPDTVGGTSVNEALANRRSWREYAAAPLTLEELSGVVWAAAGINRPGTDRLTAPSALALYPVRVYAFFAEGVYRYDARAHKLVRVLEGDRRKLTGMQDFVFAAPLNLVYLADRTVYEGRNIPAEHVRYLCGQDAAGYAENVNLYTAGHGLRAAAFPRRNCWRPSGWSRRAGSWRWRRPSANRPSGRREGRPCERAALFRVADGPAGTCLRASDVDRLKAGYPMRRVRPDARIRGWRLLVAFSEITPQRRGHQSLPDTVGAEQFQHLFARQEVHAQVLRRVEMLFAERFDARGEVAVGEVVLCGGVGREGRQQTPLAAAVARLFHQFALRGFERRGVRRLGDAGRNFIRGFAQPVAVLVDQHEPSVAGDGRDVDPVGIFEHIVIRNAASVG